ncbi:hypothetical protein E2C01_102305 [Portunus trituberculatus]|uniref:Uncharacterized protein n=1 Tax=Portunus trituberculatus TaxID=210409 RepID=A0A5B7KC83_PORTR|nr:hypothetical protein [Portunus trituberculatus]
MVSGKVSASSLVGYEGSLGLKSEDEGRSPAEPSPSQLSPARYETKADMPSPGDRLPTSALQPFCLSVRREKFDDSR